MPSDSGTVSSDSVLLKFSFFHLLSMHADKDASQLVLPKNGDPIPAYYQSTHKTDWHLRVLIYYASCLDKAAQRVAATGVQVL